MRMNQDGATTMRMNQDGATTMRMNQDGATTMRMNQDGATTMRMNQDGATTMRMNQDGATTMRMNQDGATTMRMIDIADDFSRLSLRKRDIDRKGSRTWLANNIQYDRHNQHLLYGRFVFRDEDLVASTHFKKN